MSPLPARLPEWVGKVEHHWYPMASGETHEDRRVIGLGFYVPTQSFTVQGTLLDRSQTRGMRYLRAFHGIPDAKKLEELIGESFDIDDSDRAMLTAVADTQRRPLIASARGGTWMDIDIGQSGHLAAQLYGTAMHHYLYEPKYPMSLFNLTVEFVPDGEKEGGVDHEEKGVPPRYVEKELHDLAPENFVNFGASRSRFVDFDLSLLAKTARERTGTQDRFRRLLRFEAESYLQRTRVHPETIALVRRQNQLTNRQLIEHIEHSHQDAIELERELLANEAPSKRDRAFAQDHFHQVRGSAAVAFELLVRRNPEHVHRIRDSKERSWFHPHRALSPQGFYGELIPPAEKLEVAFYDVLDVKGAVKDPLTTPRDDTGSRGPEAS